MARKLIVEIVGDASSLEKTYAKAGKSTKAFGKELDHAARGAISGTRIFTGLGRSLVFASSGFLAFQSISSFLRASIDAAIEASVAQKSLAAQMKASGQSFAANREEIERTARSYAKFGFQDDEVIASLTVLERATGGINTAIRLQGVVADLARAKNLDLAAAAAVVGKVYGGQETALRRAVPGLEKNAHGIDLIRLARAKLAGQAAANTTADERFSATLHETEQIIGTALLPILNKYLNALSQWLDKMNRSGKLQKDAAEAARIVAKAFKFAADAINLAADAIDRYNKTKVDVKKSLGPFGFLTRNFGQFADDQVKFFERTLARQRRAIEALKAGHIFSYPAEPGQGLQGPVGKRGKPAEFVYPGLQGAIGPAQVQQAKRTAQQLNQWFDAMVSRRLSRAQYAPLAQQLVILQNVAKLITRRIQITKDVTRKLNLEDQLLQVLAQQKDVRAQLAQQATDALSLNVGRAGLTASLADDIAALEAVQANLRKRIKLEGDSLDLEQQLLGVQQQLVDTRKQAAEQARAAREAAQFRGLGLGPGGEDLAPSITNLKKQLAKVKDAVKGTILDTRGNRSLFARIASELAGHFGALTDNVKQKIKEMLDAIDQQLKDHATDVTKFRHVSTAKVAAMLGLDLTPTQLRQLRAGLAGVGPGMTVPGGRSMAFAGTGAVYTGDIHVHGVTDPRDFEDKMTKRQAARGHHRRGAR